MVIWSMIELIPEPVSTNGESQNKKKIQRKCLIFIPVLYKRTPQLKVPEISHIITILVHVSIYGLILWFWSIPLPLLKGLKGSVIKFSLVISSTRMAIEFFLVSFYLNSISIFLSFIKKEHVSCIKELTKIRVNLK
jgi:hypothetical protein